ncbi:helix-turn-helix transcriptional regulator (plasmid) [Paenibacillus cellulosilyticus]|nr:helix-turn-helix transcriptional regulator [Paenibacillus cellulosilyticus]
MHKCLRCIRIQRDLSINEVALGIGIPREELIRYELDSRQAPCGIIVKLCRMYNVSADHIHVGLFGDGSCKTCVRVNLNSTVFNRVLYSMECK